MIENPGKSTLAKPAGSSNPETIAKGTAIQSLEKFLEAAPDVTESLGKFMVSVGEFEKQVGRSLEALGDDFISKGGVAELVQVAPPEVVSKFLQVMVRAAKVGSPDLKGMTAEQKVETGQQMILLATELRDLFDAMKRAAVIPGA
jgi:hypothetical protein